MEFLFTILKNQKECKLLQMKKYYLIIIFLFLFFRFPVYADIDKPLVLSNNLLDGKLIGNQIEFLEDKTGLLKIGDIRYQQVEWQKSVEDSFAFGFTPSSYWFKIDVLNPGNSVLDWYFEVSYPLLDTIELYLPGGIETLGQRS